MVLHTALHELALFFQPPAFICPQGLLSPRPGLLRTIHIKLKKRTRHMCAIDW